MYLLMCLYHGRTLGNDVIISLVSMVSTVLSYCISTVSMYLYCIYVLYGSKYLVCSYCMPILVLIFITTVITTGVITLGY